MGGDGGRIYENIHIPLLPTTEFFYIPYYIWLAFGTAVHLPLPGISNCAAGGGPNR